ncbi:MAG: hypothetical protein GY834_02270 [Bacteroidetes bacterium]|nr:hypothetical protein [Bacteroidota bacterium]
MTKSWIEELKLFVEGLVKKYKLEEIDFVVHDADYKINLDANDLEVTDDT